MVTSTSRLAYSDCYSLMDQAIADRKGVRVPFLDEGAARHFRTRLHAARQIDRNDNARLYSPEHKMYGHSVYDPVMVRIRTIAGRVYIYLENTAGIQAEAESLSEIEDGEQGPAEGGGGEVEGEDPGRIDSHSEDRHEDGEGDRDEIGTAEVRAPAPMRRI